MSDSGALPGPAVTVHWLAHAEAALRAAGRAGRAVTLLSAPGAVFTVGPLYFAEMVAQARRRVPGVVSLALLDCGGAAGRVQEALDAGLEGAVYDGPPAQRAALAAIAQALGARLLAERPPALDLLDLERPEEALAAWLAVGARDGTSAAARR